MIQQCRLGIGYEKALQEEEGVERAGKKGCDNLPIESTEMKIFWVEVSEWDMPVEVIDIMKAQNEIL